MDSVVVDTIRVIVDEGTNIYDFGKYVIGAVVLVIVMMMLFGNPFRRSE